MKSIKGKLARKAVKSTARRSAHGTASKLKREPIRAGTLFGVGCVVGIVADRLIGRRPAPRP